MSGIAGIVSPDPARRAKLPSLLAALAHRGPDGQGIVDEGDAVLGQVLLSSRRPDRSDAAGTQPLFNEEQTLWLVFDGALGNAHELRRELREKGHQFASDEASEVVLHLYEEYGDGCVEHLRGAFAFALWDSLNQRLFAARDPLGQRPLYYGTSRGGFVFASEAKAIIAAEPSTKRVDLRALDQFLGLGFVAAPLSMFDGVERLPAAHTLSVAPGRPPTIRRYWKLDYEPKWQVSEIDLLDELEEHLIEAVRGQAPEGPFGTHLDADLDTALISAILMKQVHSGPVPSFSLVGPDRGSESQAIDDLTGLYGARHREATFDAGLARLPELLRCLDEPFGPEVLWADQAAAGVAPHVKVVLGGDGGPELFGGESRYQQNISAERLTRLPAALRRGIAAPLRSVAPGRGKRLALAELDASQRYARSLCTGGLDPAAKDRCYGGPFRQALRNFDAEAIIRERFDEALATHPIDRMLATDTATRLIDLDAALTDRTSAAHGIETRSPYLDPRLVEFVARLPLSCKIQRGSARHLQRRLAERYLPAELLTRTIPTRRRIRPALLTVAARRADRVLADSRLVEEGAFQGDALRELVAESAQRGELQRSWLLLSAELWYRVRFCGESPEELAATLSDS